jgi:adenosylcobinamide-GDP ribazoletransferase
MRRALAFLTPLFGASEPRPATLTWFPFAGALLGLALGALWWGAERVWPAAVAAAIVVAADLALTGLLHVDGLADSADSLLPHLDRARRLEVMATTDVGAFGVATVGAVVVGAAAVVVLARRRIGGFTGDVLGASGMVGETAGLVVAAARW